ncbi:hypothetical protein [Sphingomonas panacisoli]|uniref:hypothetical protein n=1 Tax=Sphingomonas panacisoli TaxID=1813879 RepID=UPI0016482EC1|nr:hypothetical protein [Sphingomonas panacisoli]
MTLHPSNRKGLGRVDGMAGAQFSAGLEGLEGSLTFFRTHARMCARNPKTLPMLPTFQIKENIKVLSATYMNLFGAICFLKPFNLGSFSTKRNAQTPPVGSSCPT